MSTLIFKIISLIFAVSFFVSCGDEYKNARGAKRVSSANIERDRGPGPENPGSGNNEKPQDPVPEVPESKLGWDGSSHLSTPEFRVLEVE